MAFSSDAIGFYLQFEDEMSAELPKSRTNYAKFVRAMERLNERLFESTAGAQSQLGTLVKGMSKIAHAASMKVNIQLTTRSKRSLSRVVGDAVSDALAGMKLRLRAAMPAKLSKIFDTDANLRQLYRGIPQPPDMIGKIQQFSEGGRVRDEKGRFTKGTRDSVLGLLTPGEVVIPVKMVERLEQAFDHLELHKKVLEQGFGSKEDLLFYNKALKSIAGHMNQLAEDTRNASIDTKTKMTPQLINLRSRFDDLTKAEERASEEGDHLLGRILGPARFVALQSSLRGIKDGFSELSGGLQQGASELGAGEFQSFPDRLREIRQRLGLSAQQAAEFTGAIGDSAKALGTNFFKALEATDALVTAGEKDRTKLVTQSAQLARANRVTGADMDSLAKSMRVYTNELGGNAAGFDTLVLSVDNLTKSTDLAVNTPELMDALVQSLNNPILKDQGPEAIQTYANNLLALRAAAETVWQGESGIEKIFADALAGNDTALKQVSFLTQGQVSDLNTLTEALTRKDGLVGAFDLLKGQMQGMDAIALDKLGAEFGLDGKFLKRLEAFTEKQGAASKLTVGLDDSATSGDKLAASMEKMTTAAERLNNMIANFVGASGPMQMLVEFLDQVPVLALVAGAHLGGTLVRSLFSLGRGVVGTLGGVLGKFGGKAGKLGALLGGGKAGGDLMGAGAGALTGPGIMAAGAKIALVLAAVGAVLLLIGGYADDILPVLEQTLPGLMKLGKFVAEEVAIGISDTLVALGNIFAPLAPMVPVFEGAVQGMKGAVKMLGGFIVVGGELAVLGGAALIAEGIGALLDAFGIKSPLQSLRDQSSSVVDTLLDLSLDLQRLSPIADRIDQVQVGLQGSARFMTALKPLLDQTAELGKSAAALGDGWFTSGPLSNLRTQAEPMIDTITDLTTWFTRVPVSDKALAGVEFARVFFSKLAVTVGAMAQVGDVDADAIRKVTGAISDFRMSQPSASPSVSKDQIDAIMQVVVQSGELSPVHKDLQQTNALLQQILTAMQANGGPTNVPSRVMSPTSRPTDSAVRELTEFTR